MQTNKKKRKIKNSKYKCGKILARESKYTFRKFSDDDKFSEATNLGICSHLVMRGKFSDVNKFSVDSKFSDENKFSVERVAMPTNLAL